jgi:hypothetical protein
MKQHKPLAEAIREREQAGGYPQSTWPAPSGHGRHQVRSQAAKKSKILTLDRYQPFPIHTLPMPLREYVRQASIALGCDPAFVALPAIATAGSLIGNTRVIKLKAGWTEPCIFWVVIVGDSGSLKTPAYLKAVSPVFRLQKGLRAEFKQKMAKYKKEIKEYQKNGKEGDPPEEPILERVVVSDTTIEKLAELLEDNPRGFLVARDELNAWLGSFSRYKGKAGSSDLPHWLEMFRAGTLIVDRKTGPRTHYFVERAATSIVGGIQPGILARALTTEFIDAGLAARLLVAMPPRIPKRWSETVIEPDLEREFQVALERLLQLYFARDGEGEEMPHILGLSSEAKDAWIKHYNAWSEEQAKAEGALAAALSKLEAYTARFALLHHVVTCIAREEDDRDSPVGIESMRAGIELCHWFAREARRIYTMLAETQDQTATRRLVEFIQSRGGRISVNELQRSNQRLYRTSDDAREALNLLVNAGHGKWEPRPQGDAGGRPTEDFVLSVMNDETPESSGENGVSSYVTHHEERGNGEKT